ncbi:Thiamin diphosphate-binding protein [Anaeromyces robustus]|uniref:Thiamin diphosphate-binding protein n=1 Tax=Anaeromyces robustus TaxID=1754192 RepID=A0A1Y1X985_9FUNG|nr:Thiamin diphosphate-binding protein [Anaeromyces robustus]|eukprot:ORX81966.1 Thiamin diphosphate-binding protein [Anaeromyces robustus]
MNNTDYIDCQWYYIGNYILNKLHSIGIKNIFGIPGDYVLDFVKSIEEYGDIKFINTCDENGAAVAADAYARLNKAGCLCITYGVGGLKTLNALANAYVEKSPVILISGAPPINVKTKYNDTHMLHHEVKKDNTQLKMLKEVTCYQAILSNPYTAINELDNAFEALKKYSQPIYVELPKDFTFKKAYLLKTLIPKKVFDTNFTSSLWEAASEIIHVIKNSKHALVLVGLEVDRFNLKRKVLEFIERTQIPFCSTIMGKSTFGENHLLFAGCYVGKMSNQEIYNYVENRDCCIMMGVQITDTVTGIFSSKKLLKNDDNIKLNMNGIQVNNHIYSNVNIQQILDLILSNEEFQDDINEIYYTRHAYRHPFPNESLSFDDNNDNKNDKKENLNKNKRDSITTAKEEIYFNNNNNNNDNSNSKKVMKTNLPSNFLKKIINFEPSNQPIRNENIYCIINRWINSNTTVICDVGDPSFGTYDLFIPTGAKYLNPAIYLSLGFGVPAALGACAAEPSRRTIAICGDGGFQMTCQELSAIARYHYRPIIIVLNNNGYTTEKGLDKGIKKANTIHSWNYEKLIELIGTGRYIGNIKTEKDLDLALYRCFDMTGALTFSIKEKEIKETIKVKEKIRKLQQLQQQQQQQNKNYHENRYNGNENDNEDNNNNNNNSDSDIDEMYKPFEEKVKINNDNGYINNNEFLTNLVDKIYCKEMGCLIPFDNYVKAYKERELSQNDYYKNYDNDEENKDNDKSKGKEKDEYEYENEYEYPYSYLYQKEQEKEKGKQRKKSLSNYLKLKSNYLTLIEIQLDELDMSYGSHRFITLSQKK